MTGSFAEPFGAPEPVGGSVVARLAGEAAHDLNNVLTMIAGNLALAERHAAGNEKLIRLLTNIRVATERGVQLTQDLLALAPGSTGTSGFASEMSEDAPGQTRRILVVEDDLLVAEVAVAAFEDMGHLVDHSENAASALERLHSTSFDLVFSDIVMPGGMSGIELAEIIAETYPRLPILLATGYSSAALAQGALRFPVLAKPYGLEELSRRVGQMLG